ncbi:hypothetical protein C7974DRAFT_447693 [Boeremia exigua]|uniref:uncharacterized protein n=1 Tax=Boeremia exigua TaxID=749465 RepID=UPI001E8EC499|nr:uncharacterized protein C7974DRAFT_447693 [Boeremia exigua]KAH6642866.1 hypothetical protein C7974DRAFT_447693 [Boeremia exigua]
MSTDITYLSNGQQHTTTVNGVLSARELERMQEFCQNSPGVLAQEIARGRQPFIRPQRVARGRFARFNTNEAAHAHTHESQLQPHTASIAQYAQTQAAAMRQLDGTYVAAVPQHMETYTASVSQHVGTYATAMPQHTETYTASVPRYGGTHAAAIPQHTEMYTTGGSQHKQVEDEKGDSQPPEEAQHVQDASASDQSTIAFPKPSRKYDISRIVDFKSPPQERDQHVQGTHASSSNTYVAPRPNQASAVESVSGPSKPPMSATGAAEDNSQHLEQAQNTHISRPYTYIASSPTQESAVGAVPGPSSPLTNTAPGRNPLGAIGDERSVRPRARLPACILADLDLEPARDPQPLIRFPTPTLPDWVASIPPAQPAPAGPLTPDFIREIDAELDKDTAWGPDPWSPTP